MIKKKEKKDEIIEPEYQQIIEDGDDTIQRMINPDPELIEHDTGIDSETIDGAIEEIIRRSHFWEKYALLRGLEVKYFELTKELKHEKVIRQLVKDRFRAEDLTIVEKGQGREIDLKKMEGLVQIVKSVQLKEDVLRGAVPLLKSDKKNATFSIFYMAARTLDTVSSDPRVTASCIEGMLYMIDGLEDTLDKDRLEQINEIVQNFVSAHRSPVSVKHGFEYALKRHYFHLAVQFIKSTGRFIRSFRDNSLNKAIDMVRAINMEAKDFAGSDLNLRDELENFIVKELIGAGAIELACKLAKRYGITEKKEKSEVYELLLDIFHAQDTRFKKLYGLRDL